MSTVKRNVYYCVCNRPDQKYRTVNAAVRAMRKADRQDRAEIGDTAWAALEPLYVVRVTVDRLAVK